MKTRRTHDFQYNNGFFSKSRLLDEPVEVEILGIMCPPDPCMVFIREGNREYNCPTYALEIPDINWDALMSERQKKTRRRAGERRGNGKPQKLIPWSEVPKL